MSADPKNAPSTMESLGAQFVQHKVTESLQKWKEEALEVKRALTDGPCGLKLFCFSASVAALVIAIFQIIGNLLSPLKIIISVYAALFAFIAMILEVKPLFCTRFLQQRVVFWMKLLSRVWGRGLFYLLIAGMQLAQNSIGGFITGSILVVCAFLCFGLSMRFTSKLNTLHKGILKTYGDKNVEHIRAAFDKYDMDGSGALDKTELGMATKDLGAELFSPDEMIAMFDLLDTNHDGKIEYDEFRDWWLGEKNIAYAATV